MSEIIDGMDQLDIFDWLEDGPDEEPCATNAFDMFATQNYLPSVIVRRNSYKLLVKE